jgi:hypothetical protein
MLSPNATKCVTVNRGPAGGVTVTLKPQEATCWAASVAVQVTAVVPTGNVDPLGGTQTVVTGASPPLAVGAPKLTAIGPPDCDERETGAGHEIVSGSIVGGGGDGGDGGSAGAVTVTVKSQESTRCRASVAVQVTGVVPTGNRDPLGGTQAVVIGSSPAWVAGSS